MFGKYLAPAFLVVGAAFAQNGCSADTNTIQNKGDAEALSDCQTLSGDLVIAEQATGTIRLDGIERIEGSLICRDAVDLQSIEAPQLTIIDENFELNGLTILSNLNFGSLSSVKRIQWTALPALDELSFTTEVTKADEISITNTNLKSLDGINLEQVRIFDVTNNLYLSKMELQLGNITQQLTLQANSRDLVVSFPNLQWAYNMTFRNCSEVKLPSLASVNGSMGFVDNYFESFSAPNLTKTGPGGSLVFVSNSRLTNISIPRLESIGGTYQIANNTKLDTVDGFPILKSVGGAIDFRGTFTDVTLDSLEDVRGAFNIKTSAEFDCDPFKQLKSGGIVKGRFECKGEDAAQADPTGTGDDSSPTGAAGQVHADTRPLIGLAAGAAAWLYLAL